MRREDALTAKGDSIWGKVKRGGSVPGFDLTPPNHNGICRFERRAVFLAGTSGEFST
jgi:hypothetical protein